MMAPRLAWIRVGLVAAAILVTAPGAWSQPSEALPPEATAETEIGPIPVEALAAEGAEMTGVIGGVLRRMRADSSLLAIRDMIMPAEERLGALEAETGRTLAASPSPSLRQLRNLRSDWQVLGEDFREWQISISVRIGEIGEEADNLAHLIETWQMTAGQAAQERLPGEVVAEIDRTLSDLEGTEGMLYAHRNDLILLEYDVADLLAKCGTRIYSVSTEIDRMRGRLLITDGAPLWSREAVSEADAQIGLKVGRTVVDYYRSLENYVAREAARVAGHIAFYLVAFLCIALLERRARAHTDQDEAVAGAVATIRPPAAAAVVVTILVARLFHPQPPEALALLLNLLLLIPLLAMVPHLLPQRFKPAVYALAIIYTADSVSELLPQHSFTGRILKLGIRLAIIATAFWLLRRLHGPPGEARGRRGRRLAWLGLGTAICLIAVSIVADLAGSVALADLLLEGTVESFYLGLVTWLAVVVLRALVMVILNTGVVRRTNLVQRHGDRLWLGITRVLNAAGFVIWLLITLDGFKVLEPAYGGVKRALASSFKVGTLEVVTGDVVLFFVIIWLSFMISRIIGAILREEVYPKVRLPRGVPMAISKLTQFTILLIGFAFALGAAGIDLNRFTLLAGALGVGIGFGLQNIVSNLVSGVIVLLERPVQTGDMVRIGANEGRVMRIGLRATVIRTLDGAEVLVPNSRLVLDEVTNWTLSDQQRRIDIQVGVAYGSDTDKVTELLLKVASEHDDVLDSPEPSALFSGFGDSSLNFTLRAWTARYRDFFRVGSELTAGVNRALAEGGITIPFPQRDVHIGSGNKGLERGSPGREE